MSKPLLSKEFFKSPIFKEISVTLAVVLLAGMGLLALYLNSPNSKKPLSKLPVFQGISKDPEIKQQEEKKEEPKQEPVVPPADNPPPVATNNIIQSSAENLHGISLGYLNNNQTSWLKKAKAADENFTPVLFYSKKIDGDSQLFMFNTADKKESQITTTKGYSAEKGIFSSTSQKLSYQQCKTGDQNSCKVVIINIKSKEIIREFSEDGFSSRPEAWSPDGKKLIIWELGNEANIPIPSSGGAQGFLKDNKVIIFNVEDGTIITLPEPETGAMTREEHWLDSDNVIVTFINNNVTNDKVYKINTGENKLVEQNLTFPNPFGLQFPSPEEIFYQTRERVSSEITAGLARGKINESSSKIGNAERVYDYLVEKEKDPGKVVFVRVNNSEVYDTQGIFSVSLKDNQLKHHKEMQTAAFILGWYKDYDHVVYINTFDSSQSQTAIKILNLQTNEEETLVEGQIIN